MHYQTPGDVAKKLKYSCEGMRILIGGDSLFTVSFADDQAESIKQIRVRNNN